MKRILSIALIFLTQIYSYYAYAQHCSKLQVSTNLTETRSDVIKNGRVDPDWTENAINPIFTQESLEIDYFYLTVTDTHQKLTQKDIRLTVDNPNFSDSRIELISTKDSGKGVFFYTVAVRYRCKKYGGALLTYSVEFMIPNCGSNKVYWKKVCGNPLTPRNGLSLDIEINKKYNQTIVQNGVLKNAQYFDADLDNYVMKIPKQQSESVFYIYMDINEKDTENQMKETDDIFEMLSDVMMMVPEERVDKFFIDANEMIMNPIALGRVVNGGMITKQKQKITVKYDCKTFGESNVQLQIPLTYFRDINIFFVKQCGHQYGQEFWESEQRNGIFSTIVMIAFFVILGGTLYNVVYQNKTGIDAVPYLREVRDFLMDFTVVQEGVQYVRQRIPDRIGRQKRMNDYEEVKQPDENTPEGQTDTENQQQQDSQNEQELKEVKKEGYGSL